MKINEVKASEFKWKSSCFFWVCGADPCAKYLNDTWLFKDGSCPSLGLLNLPGFLPEETK